MRQPQTVAAILAMVALLVIGAACGSDEASPETAGLSPLAPEFVTPAPQEPKVEPGDTSGGEVSSTMLVPRPESIEVLVRMSHIIVLGTISAVLDEIRIGTYGEDGNPYIPIEESGTPYTDYEVRVESVLKNDGDVEHDGSLVLRMFGHLSQQSDVVISAVVQLPQPGSLYMLALGRNPDGTYGSGSEGLINITGEKVAYADGVAFSTELTGEEFVEAVRQEVDRNDSPAANLTHGSPLPPAPSGSPLPSLKFGDVRYVYGGYGEQPSGEGTVFVIDGTEISTDDLVRVGTTNDGNTAGILEGLVVYRLKDDGTNDVYTFRPGEVHVNPEDGQIFEFPAVWTRWTTL